MKTNKENQSSQALGNLKFVHGARLLFGLAFVVFGLNGLFHVVPTPPLHGPGAELVRSLTGSGYLMTFVYATELVSGVLLLANRFVPLALALLAPIVVNIVAFHVFLSQQELPVALVLLAFELALAFAYRRAFRSMLAPRVTPEPLLPSFESAPLSR